MALTETTHAGDFLISYGNGNISFEEVTLISGQDLDAGTVLGKITASAKYTRHDEDASDGSQTAVAILLAATNATAGDTQCTIIARDAEVNGAQLIWADSSPTPDQVAGAADLLTKGIVVR